MPSASAERTADLLGGLVADRDLGRRAIGLGHAEQLVQFATGRHALDDVGAADQFAIDIELRNGRPVSVFLDALPDLLVGEHIDRHVVIEQVVEDTGRRRRESATRRVARSLHEQDDTVAGEHRLDALADGFWTGHGDSSKRGR